MSRTPKIDWNVDVANFIEVKVGSVYIAAKMAGMQNVDIANLQG
jgi:hypothetical protein